VAWPSALIRVGDLPCVSLGEVLDLAADMKRDSAGWNGALAGKTLACFFDPPTSGEIVTAVAAGERLGMVPVMLPRAELEPGPGAPVGHVSRSFSAVASALVMHAFPHRMVKEVAAAATVPVINAVSDEHRPCQALADLLTLREHFGDLAGLTVAFVGDGRNSAAHSLMEAGALAAMNIRIACPPAHRPAPLIEFGARVFAELHGGHVTVTEDAREAVAGADAVYTSAWGPPGRHVEDGATPASLGEYRVTARLMKLAKPNAVFMHCLPIGRGEAAAVQVAEGPRSAVGTQAANRVPIEQAAIYALVTGGRDTPA
jgi:ornithine carbamoyltransferase